MPSDEEVSQRAGGGQAMTGIPPPRIHGTPAACRTRISGLYGRPLCWWTTVPQRSLQYVWHLSVTHNGWQVARYSDLLETASHPWSARSALWDVSIACEQVDSSPPCGAESGLSPV